MRIHGQPITEADIAEAPPLDPSTYLLGTGGHVARDPLAHHPLARRDRFVTDLIARGMPPADARTRAERTANWTDARERS